MDHLTSVPPSAIPLPRDLAAARPAIAAEPAIRTLIIGTGPRAVAGVTLLQRGGRRTIVGALDVSAQGTAELPGIPCLGTLDNLVAVIQGRTIDEIYLALPLRSCFDEWMEVQRVGHALGVRVAFDLDVLGPNDRVEISREQDRFLLRCNVHPSGRRVAHFVKRVIDVIGSLALLIALLPLMTVVALLTKLTSRGPVFYKQDRVGLGCRAFTMWKFRTMVADADARRSEVGTMDPKGIMFKAAEDPRVTRIGSILRQTSIDEIPQLFNVLRGDMSLVGPRPIPLWVFHEVDDPLFRRRFAVLPGMSGLWQVEGRQQHYLMMAQRDLRYVDEWSLGLDLRILLKTVPAVLRRTGAR